MNWSTVALALLAWQMLKGNDKQQPSASVKNMLSAETQTLIDSVQTLTDKNSSQQDKTGALLGVISNPMVADIAQSLMNNGKKPQKDSAQNSPLVNEEGYVFEPHSAESKRFFEPINDIADAEVKHKLYWFYDNWYVKN